jgi:serine/threonine protein kinase
METHRLALPAGYRIENYEIQAALGKGGFGITYVAYDWTLGRHMAIKELLPDTIATRIDGSTVVAMSPSHEESWQWARERFVEEARILAGFRHPNIIAIHRLIEANGTVYLVMDHLEGESYETRLRRIGREPDQASLMAVIGPLLDGLQEVHAAGLLHRDIKPENILFDKRGNPILIDFGAARATVGATMTMTSIVTHGYSPIEQYQTKAKMGPWTDIYAVGAVMCRAITSEKPPVASDRIIDDEFNWVSNRGVSGFGEQFLIAVDWALRVWPNDRPQKISEYEPSLNNIASMPQQSFIAETDPDNLEGCIIRENRSCPNCNNYISANAFTCMHCRFSLILYDENLAQGRFERIIPRSYTTQDIDKSLETNFSFSNRLACLFGVAMIGVILSNIPYVGPACSLLYIPIWTLTLISAFLPSRLLLKTLKLVNKGAYVKKYNAAQSRFEFIYNSIDCLNCGGHFEVVALPPENTCWSCPACSTKHDRKENCIFLVPHPEQIPKGFSPPT